MEGAEEEEDVQWVGARGPASRAGSEGRRWAGGHGCTRSGF